MDEMLPFAKHLLGSYGAFPPFGGLIKTDEQSSSSVLARQKSPPRERSW